MKFQLRFGERNPRVFDRKNGGGQNLFRNFKYLSRLLKASIKNTHNMSSRCVGKKDNLVPPIEPSILICAANIVIVLKR